MGVAGVMPQSLKAGVGLGDEAIPLLAVNNNALRITGTFLDEISHDIPHQNWGEKEWDADFRYMKAIGIDTVIMIRCGYRKFITYPSAYLVGKGCYAPSVDLLDLFLRLSDRYGMKFYFGLYDSGVYWDTGDMTMEMEHNRFVVDEVWNKYGAKHKSFGGWYVSTEISRKTKALSRRSIRWASSARMFRAVCQRLSLRGLTAKRLSWRRRRPSQRRMPLRLPSTNASGMRYSPESTM